MPQANINGFEMYFEEHGSGEPIIFHHGFTGSHDNFRGVAERLPDSYRCILMDARGAGDSSHPEDGYTIEQYARDVVGLADHLGIDRFSYVGHSQGGGVGMQLGLEHATRFTSTRPASSGCRAPRPRRPARAGPVLRVSTSTQSPASSVGDMLSPRTRNHRRSPRPQARSSRAMRTAVGDRDVDVMPKTRTSQPARTQSTVRSFVFQKMSWIFWIASISSSQCCALTSTLQAEHSLAAFQKMSVQLGDRLEVRRLEVVRPQDEQLALGDLGLLLLDRHVAAHGVQVLDRRLGVRRVRRCQTEQLVGHRAHGLGGDARRRGIVDAARTVAVRVGVLGRKALLGLGDDSVDHGPLLGESSWDPGCRAVGGRPEQATYHVGAGARPADRRSIAPTGRDPQAPDRAAGEGRPLTPGSSPR